LTKDGEVMEGSNKRLVVHSKRRENGIGYEIIPADKWTRRQLSQTPSSVLYVNGNTDLYVQPFYQDEFNDLFYQKTIRNDAMGNPDIMTWIKIQQVPKTRIEIIHPKKETESIVEAPYYVEQIKGSALGYKIVPFDPEGKHKDREPSLMAFHIPVSSDARTIELKLQDKDGKALPSGERQIRVISKSGLWYLSLILAFIPIGVMVVVLILRARRYS
ncbi:MAG TPA: hypothetical protein VMX75_05910, partial [Spirochaetia bacterium]|nr:hypothetical protein [Spirochaetia bacterium]